MITISIYRELSMYEALLSTVTASQKFSLLYGSKNTFRLGHTTQYYNTLIVTLIILISMQGIYNWLGSSTIYCDLHYNR